jgi:hypothetical protein
MPLICVKPEAEYFCKEGWTAQLTDLPVRPLGAALCPSLPATNAKRLRKGANGSRERAPDDRGRSNRGLRMDCSAATATKAGDL